MTSDLPFFDPDKARGASGKPDVGQDVTDELLADGARRGPISVSALVARIRGALAEAFPKLVTVVGQLSNVKRHGSGHLYFRLKDAEASIDAAMFRQFASRLRFTPEDGLEVVVDGKVDVYDVRGQLQLYAERMTPRGTGALELAFRQLREKLAAEGLFDPAGKKPIPRYPRAIGVVTSATGAAIRDIRRTLARRWPAANVYLLPVPVQGEGAARQIARAVALLDANARRYDVDTLIVARGGGSLEDLWAFNEEPLARAIYAATTPVICGVGHEVDVTIADLVADLRAPTPTAAAELAVPDAGQVRRGVGQLSSRLRTTAGQAVRQARAALAAIGRSAVFRDPTWRLRTQSQRLDELAGRCRAGAKESLARHRQRLAPASSRLAALHPARLAAQARAGLGRLAGRLAWSLGAKSKAAGDVLAGLDARLQAAHPRHRLKLARQQVAALGRQIEAMSYRSVLRRGFSVTRTAENIILRSAGQVSVGQRIETELADGKFTSMVDGSPGRAVEDAPSRHRKARAGKEPTQRRLFD